jgi:hypothetical protein
VRATDVRDKIVQAVEAIVPDTVAHSGDVFSQAPPQLDYPPRDRVFMCTRTIPQAPADLLFAGADTYDSTFELAVSYTSTPNSQNRVLLDGDLICDSIKLLESQNAQILFTDVKGAADFEDGQGNRLCSFSIRVVYDRRDP